MAWKRFTWVDDDGSLTVGTPFSAARMNNIEDGVEENGKAVTDAVTALETLISGKQASDSDLTAIAALTTTEFGRSFLTLAGASAARTLLGLGTAATEPASAFQPADSDLTAIAALTTTSFGRSVLTQASAEATRTLLGLGTAATKASTEFQPIDSDLTAIAALSTTEFGRSLLTQASASAARTALGLGTAATEPATAFQPADSDLTAIAALTTTSIGRSLLAIADAAAGRTILAAASQAALETEEAARKLRDEELTAAVNLRAKTTELETEKTARELGDRKPESLYDTFSKPTAGTGNLTWTHTPKANFVQGIVVGVAQNYRAKLPFAVTKVTYGGIEMKRLMLLEEAGMASHAFYWLPSAEIPQGAQSVVVTVSNAESKRQAFCASLVSDEPLRPIFRSVQAPSGATAMSAEINNTLEAGAYLGMASVTTQPSLKAATAGEVLFTENLGSEATQMWMTVQVGKEPNAGTGTGESERPKLQWTMASAAYGATGIVIGKVKDWGIRTALPTLRAGYGDTCRYIADSANGVMWHLAYDGEGEYPWKKIGGAPLLASSQVARELNNQTTYASLPTDPLAVTLPLKGDYDIEYSCGLTCPAPAVGVKEARVSYAVGATAAEDTWGGVSYSDSAASTRILTDAVRKTRWTGLAASVKVEEKGRTGGAYAVSFSRRRLWVDPIRVG